MKSICNMNSINNYKKLLCIIYILIFEILSSEEKDYKHTNNDYCKMHDGGKGACVPLRECKTAQKLIKTKIHPNICRFEGLEPVVCCYVTGEKARKSCKKYWPENLEIKSNSSLVEEFPYFAGIGYHQNGRIPRKCSGSLISEKFILTAAFCATYYKLQIARIRLGSSDIFLKNFGEPQEFTIINTHLHPNYSNNQPYQPYDSLALLELNESVKITKYVKPACLQIEDDIFPNPYLVAIGWNRVEVNKTKTEQMINYPEFVEYSHAECAKFYSFFPKGVDENTQFCAGKEGICNLRYLQEIGSPLQTRIINSAGYSIVGVAIAGKSCNTTYGPAGYIRVSKYIDWIESIVWPD